MARRKTEYKLYIIDHDNHQRFYSESFKTKTEAKAYFKTIKELAVRACIMEYQNDRNTRNWYWGYNNDYWV